MNPWSKRLKDLQLALDNCCNLYFNPDGFRQNLNQFLLISRTVTFLIQKNKHAIPDYENWYRSCVLEKWSVENRLMDWAKKSRNFIEKEGDLSVSSTVTSSLIHSYYPAEDIEIHLSKDDLFKADIKKLIRFARRNLSSASADAAVVQVERKWVSETLQEWEILDALKEIYREIFAVCNSLNQLLGQQTSDLIKNPKFYSSDFNGKSRRHYIKINGEKSHKVISKIIDVDKNFKMPKDITTAWKSVSTDEHSFDSIFSTFTNVAEAVFLKSGNHYTMAFLFDKNWRVIRQLSTEFMDHADKFIFWRGIAEEITKIEAHGLLFISESWLREAKHFPHRPIRNLEITGEMLTLFLIGLENGVKSASWEIIDSDSKRKKLLGPREISSHLASEIPFLFPSYVAMMNL